MTLEQIMQQLSELGDTGTKQVLLKHGAKEPFFGVKVGDLKPIQKKLKKNHMLAKELYRTGNSDAMYLAGLIADEKAMTKADLQEWVSKAHWYLLSEYTVAQLAAESAHGWELAKEWIDSDNEGIASAGWSTLSNLVNILPDEKLDLPFLGSLLSHIAPTIHQQPNRVRYTMNSFVIAAGTFVEGLTAAAKQAASEIGMVKVDMGETSCKVPDALTYLKKMESLQKIGKKKRRARC
ncbi:DNA alkylation repair protein [Pontibacter locisalis]|uniref:DNA alkylation repair protein n=1 Tax=Pontibacter locisalis TaxID=1719035 RepID=A0ABW5ISX1_9BACT